MNDQQARDDGIVADYHDGMTVTQIAMANGIGTRRVQQILKSRGVTVTKPKGSRPMTVLSRLHLRAGMALYEHRTITLQMEVPEAAERLGWNAHKLRKVEQGTTDVNILDLADIATFMGLSVPELWSQYIAPNHKPTGLLDRRESIPEDPSRGVSDAVAPAGDV